MIQINAEQIAINQWNLCLKYQPAYPERFQGPIETDF